MYRIPITAVNVVIRDHSECVVACERLPKGPGRRRKALRAIIRGARNDIIARKGDTSETITVGYEGKNGRSFKLHYRIPLIPPNP